MYILNPSSVAKWMRVANAPVNRNTSVQISDLQPLPMRMLIDQSRSFKPEGEDREFAFLTNNYKWAASTIAAIYKERWRVELFFKSIKQNFRIKSFVGTTKNAVLNQIWTALIAYLLVRIVQFKAKFGWHFSQLLAMLSMMLFNYENMAEWIDDPYPKPPLNTKIQQELMLGG